MRATPLILALSGLVLAGVAGVTYWRGASGRETAADAHSRTAAAMAMMVSQATLVPVAPDAFGGLDKCPVVRQQLVTPVRLELLRTSVRNFLTARFAAPPEEYVAWRKSQGYIPRSIDDLRRSWFLDQACKAYLGRAPAPDDTPEGLYVSCVYVADQRHSAEQVLKKIGAAPEAWSIEFKLLSPKDRLPPNGADSPAPARALSYSRVLSAPQSWWSYPRSMDSLLDRNHSVLFARVAFVSQFGNGSNRPLGLAFYWDEVGGRWVLNAAAIGGRTAEDSVRLEF